MMTTMASSALKTAMVLCAFGFIRGASAQLAPSILNWDGSRSTMAELPQTLAETGFNPKDTACLLYTSDAADE